MRHPCLTSTTRFVCTARTHKNNGPFIQRSVIGLAIRVRFLCRRRIADFFRIASPCGLSHADSALRDLHNYAVRRFCSAISSIKRSLQLIARSSRTMVERRQTRQKKQRIVSQRSVIWAGYQGSVFCRRRIADFFRIASPCGLSHVDSALRDLHNYTVSAYL